MIARSKNVKGFCDEQKPLTLYMDAWCTEVRKAALLAH